MKQITKLKALFQKPLQRQTYDHEKLRPVIRASICTGEQVAGFRDLQTGKFSEVMLLRTDRDLADFCRQYDISPEDLSTEY